MVCHRIQEGSHKIEYARITEIMNKSIFLLAALISVALSIIVQTAVPEYHRLPFLDTVFLKFQKPAYRP